MAEVPFNCGLFVTGLNGLWKHVQQMVAGTTLISGKRVSTVVSFRVKLRLSLDKSWALKRDCRTLSDPPKTLRLPGVSSRLGIGALRSELVFALVDLS
jgi:hypothetical protein